MFYVPNINRRLAWVNEIIKSVQLVVGSPIPGNMIFILLPTPWCGLGFRLNLLLSVMAVIWRVEMNSMVQAPMQLRNCTFIAVRGKCFFYSLVLSPLPVC